MAWHADRITSASFADRRDVNSAATVPTDYILAILAIAFRAADAASVERGAPTSRLLDDHESQRLPADIGGKQVQIAVLHFAQRHAQFVAVGNDQPCAGRRGICPRINEVRREHQDYRQRSHGGRSHPTALAAVLRGDEALLSLAQRLFRSFVMPGGLPLTKNQQRGRPENENKEEKFVVHDRTDDRHLMLTG